MLNNAVEQGRRVHEEARVLEVLFEGERAVGVIPGYRVTQIKCYAGAANHLCRHDAISHEVCVASDDNRFESVLVCN
jgi:hypothetical protein